MGRFYEEDYEGEKFEKFTHRKNKGHKKGHQSRSANSERKTWEMIIEKSDEDLEMSSESHTIFKPTVVPTSTPEPSFSRVEHQFGDNTHEVKGVKIDFDGVADIQKIDNIKDGRRTYGIKFLFKGKKGLFRIVWFNSNISNRDVVYNTEYSFWLNIKNKEDIK